MSIVFKYSCLYQILLGISNRNLSQTSWNWKGNLLEYLWILRVKSTLERAGSRWGCQMVSSGFECLSYHQYCFMKFYMLLTIILKQISEQVFSFKVVPSEQFCSWILLLVVWIRATEGNQSGNFIILEHFLVPIWYLFSYGHFCVFLEVCLVSAVPCMFGMSPALLVIVGCRGCPAPMGRWPWLTVGFSDSLVAIPWSSDLHGPGSRSPWLREVGTGSLHLDWVPRTVVAAGLGWDGCRVQGWRAGWGKL